MNGNDEREVNVNMIGFGGLERKVVEYKSKYLWMKRKKTVYELENEMDAGIEKVYVEMIKCSGERGLTWLWNIFIIMWIHGVMLEN